MENKTPKEFRVSEVVEMLAERYAENTFVKQAEVRLTKETEAEKAERQQNEKFHKINWNLVDKAFQKICKMYNKDYKSRNFVKHLISNFLPINPWNKVLNFPEEEISKGKNVDCLLNIKLAGINQISEAMSEVGMIRMRINAKCLLEKREKYTDEEIKELNDVKSKYPIEIVKSSFGYMSENSDKYLCTESLQSLLAFAQECIMRDVRDIVFLMSKKRVAMANNRLPKKHQLNNKQINEVSKANAFDMSHHLSKDTIEKLQGIHEAHEKGEINDDCTES